MKKLLISIALLISIKSYSLTLQDSSKVKRTEEYAELIATQKLFSTKVTITVDYGEVKNLWKDNRVKDDNGKVTSFNTVVDAMNYMNSLGWEFVNAFPVSTGSGGGMVYHFYFKRKIV